MEDVRSIRTLKTSLAASLGGDAEGGRFSWETLADVTVSVCLKVKTVAGPQPLPLRLFISL